MLNAIEFGTQIQVPFRSKAKNFNRKLDFKSSHNQVKGLICTVPSVAGV